MERGCNSGISLLKVVEKIFVRIAVLLLQRVLTSSVIMDEQAGFRASRGCVDQFFAVRQVIEKDLSMEAK